MTLPVVKINLTNAVVDNLVPGHYKDIGTTGLHISAGQTKKTWFYHKKILGRTTDIKLGSPPAMYRDGAKKRITEIESDLLAGVSPHDKRVAAASQATTLAGLWKEYKKLHLIPKVRTWERDLHLWRHLGPMHKAALCDIRRKKIIELHVKVGRDTGERTANRMVKYLRAMLNRAVDWEYLQHNPALRIDLFPEVKRKRYLMPHEEEKFFGALADESVLLRDLVMMALYTGARKQNVLRMRWEDVFLDRAIWIIPKETTKTQEDYTIPLISDALLLLKRRRLSVLGEWVFPHEASGLPVGNLHRLWKPFRDEAGVPDLRWHDLRRTFATKQSTLGIDLKQISESLCHADLASTEGYAQINLELVRQNMEKALGGLKAAGGEK